MRVEREIEIAATPEAVFDLIADVDRLGEWVTIHQYVELDGDKRELSEGAELSQCLKLAGQRFKVRWKVARSDRPHRLTWKGRGPMRSGAKVDNLLTPCDGGTRFSYTNEFNLPGGPLGRMAGPVVKRATAGELEESLRKLRSLLECA